MSRIAERFRRGGLFVWFSGTLLAFTLAMILCLVGFIVAKGMGYFWPSPLVQVQSAEGPVLGEITGHEPARGEETEKIQLRVGNRDIFGQDFRWVPVAGLGAPAQPKDAILIERLEYGPFIGRIVSLSHEGQVVATGPAALAEALKRLPETNRLRHRIQGIEKGQVGDLNRRIEQFRLSRRKLEGAGNAVALQALDAKVAGLQAEYDQIQTSLEQSRTEAKAWTLGLQTADGQTKDCALGSVVRMVPANAMGPFEKVGVYLSRLWEFLADDPRESNTEGGIFPAIFGTVMMVLVMSVLVVPLGVITALYLREYARQGWLVRAVRVAVNNLAGVPSIVFGVFGLGFFVYGLGGGIDRLFFSDSLPTPTYGTGGILWASLTLALLTVPVVVVATEEALGAVARSQREASLAMGATKWQTLWNVVLPSATPGILTGLILAIARGAGEVAPLMLTGVVKLAPSMPLDGTFPFFHLDRKFMHLGFHIYDVGFQSPNSEAAKPMVFMASVLLLLVVVVLNLFALNLRRKLRARLGGEYLLTLHPGATHMEIEDPRPVPEPAHLQEPPPDSGLRPASFITPDLPLTDPSVLSAPIMLRVERLNLFYGEKQALADIDLKVARNSVMSFIGPSGCGKSTLLRCLNRMNDLIDDVRIEGRVLLGNTDIYSPETDVIALRKRAGMVFQKSNPFPKSIFENVAYGLRIQGQGDRAVLEEAVERSLRGAGLWDEVKDRLKDSAQGLSGGQQQRLCIARALAVRPEIILMDEPCSALDPIATARVEELILELKREFTIVIVTHNMQQAARVSDHTAFFWMGKLIETGLTEKMFTNPGQRMTEDYITGRFG